MLPPPLPLAMQNLSEIWYYALADGSAVGPLSKTALERLAREGQIDRQTLVWDGGQFEWRPLYKAAALSGSGPSAPAPAAGDVPAPASPRTSQQPQSAKSQRRAAVEQQRQDRLQRRQKPDKPAPFVPVGAGSVAIPAPPSSRATSPGVKLPRQDPRASSAATQTGSSAERVPLALQRWLARAIDIATLGLLGAAALTLLASAFLPELAALAWQAWVEPGLLAWFALLALIPLEALALAIAGRTPGKALLGISVRNRDGRGLGPLEAITRSWQVAVKGMLLGIPPFTLLAQGWGFVRVVNDNQTAWDQAATSEVVHAPLSGTGWLRALGVTVAAWAMLLSGESADLLTDIIIDLLPLLQG